MYQDVGAGQWVSVGDVFQGGVVGGHGVGV